MSDQDQAWIGDFLDDVLAKWSEHADTPEGLFNPYLDREWKHNVDGPRTLVSQCRLIYNFARAFERSGDQAYADLTKRGLESLVRSFSSGDEGGWVWACRSDGSTQDATYDAYGHAFVMLALATVADVFHDDTYRDLAKATWAFIQGRFGDQHGGLIWHVSRQGDPVEDIRSQNPMMHTFESLLALAAVEEGGQAPEDALKIWRFLKARMPRFGCLPEWYDSDWRPITTGQQSHVEVGHVFEWAFLLSEASHFLPQAGLLEQGKQMLTFGMQIGYDTREGGIYSRVDFKGKLTEQRKGWWEQCEAIRAMHRYVARHGATEIAEPLQRSIEFVRETFIDDVYGGWYERPAGTGGEPSLLKGHAFKLDYHVVNMCRELLDS